MKKSLSFIKTPGTVQGAEPANLSIANAGVLDIPLIFDLMLEGSISGVFTDRYLLAAGHFKLFMWVAKATLAWPGWLQRQTRFQMLAVKEGAQSVGFVQLRHGTLASGDAVIKLELLAIAKEHRRRGFGTWVVGSVIGKMPEHAILEVYCSKYARTMQHVLHHLRFKRDKVMAHQLVRFSWRKEPAMQVEQTTP